MEPRIIYKEVEITEDEKLDRAMSLVKELTTIDELTAEAKATAKNYKTRIDSLEMKRDELMETIATGKEERSFRCSPEKNFKTGMMDYYEITTDGEITKTIIRSIPLTPDELQRSIED